MRQGYFSQKMVRGASELKLAKLGGSEEVNLA